MEVKGLSDGRWQLQNFPEPCGEVQRLTCLEQNTIKRNLKFCSILLFLEHNLSGNRFPLIGLCYRPKKKAPPMEQIIRGPQDLMLEKAAFSAVLTPHRSLSRTGFIVLMAAISSLSFVAGAVFFMMGAWPIPGFFGLEVLLIYLGFKWNYRTGRAFEAVNIIDHELIISKVDPEGRARHFTFNPYWARLEVEERPGDRVELAVRSHGRRLGFGQYLTSDEKRDFAQALQHALAAYRA